MVNQRIFSFFLMLFCACLSLAGCSHPGSSSQPPGVDSRTGTPTPIPTAPPMPSQSQVQNRFVSEVSPLVEKLLAAPAGSDAAVDVEDQIIYLPLTRPLLAVQMILELDNASPDLTLKQVYILYDYSRGGSLGKAYKDKPQSLLTQADTQTITASVRVVVKDKGKSHLIEEKSATGGEGSISYRELVEKAVPALDTLPAETRATVEHDLEMIIGYACGIDMDPGLSYHQRTKLFSLALTSQNWADKTQAVFFLQTMNPPPVDAASELFSSLTDQEIGHKAGQALARLTGDTEIFQRVLGLVDSSIQIQRLRAAEILGMIPSPPTEVSDALIKLSMDEDPDVRQAAAGAFNLRQNPDTTQKLLTFLDDPDPEVRMRAVETLGGDYSPDESLLEKLSDMLGDSSARVRQAAAQALSYKKDPSGTIMDALLAAIQTETDVEALQSELDAVNTFRDDEKTLSAIQEALSSPDPSLRTAAFSRLEYYSDLPGSGSILALALEDEEESLREEASSMAIGMVMMQKESNLSWSQEEFDAVLAALTDGLDDKSREVRLNCAQALAYLENDAREAVPALMEALMQDDGTATYAYIDALERITGAAPGYDTTAWEDWWLQNQGQ